MTLAPVAAAICTPYTPMPPTPTNSASSPAMRPDRLTASNGVATASETTLNSHSACDASAASGTGQRKRAGTTTCDAKPPLRSFPGITWRRQIVRRPARQRSHSPHGSTAGTTTARPTSVASTPGPTARTMPLISCPRTRGSAPRVLTPWWRNDRSVLQTPQPDTSTVASPAPGATGASNRCSSGAPGATIIHASHCPSVRVAIVGAPVGVSSGLADVAEDEIPAGVALVEREIEAGEALPLIRIEPHHLAQELAVADLAGRVHGLEVVTGVFEHVAHPHLHGRRQFLAFERQFPADHGDCLDPFVLHRMLSIT